MDGSGFDGRFDFGNKAIPAAKKILSEYFCTSVDKIEVAPDAMDKAEATDLLLPDGRRVALRHRHAAYRRDYPDDITIRLQRNASNESEWTKIKAGKVRYMLYGFESKDGGFVGWKLIDLAALVDALRWRWDDWGVVCQKHEPAGREPFMSINVRAFRNKILEASIILRASVES